MFQRAQILLFFTKKKTKDKPRLKMKITRFLTIATCAIMLLTQISTPVSAQDNDNKGGSILGVFGAINNLGK